MPELDGQTPDSAASFFDGAFSRPEVEQERKKKSRIWMIMFIPIFAALVVTGVKIYDAHKVTSYCNNAKAFTTATDSFLSNKSLPLAQVESGTQNVESLLLAFTSSAPSNYQSQAKTFGAGMKSFFDAGARLYVIRSTSKTSINLSKLPDNENPIKQIILLDQKLKTPQMQDFAKNLLTSCKINLGIVK
jgi:hypothetical protein